MASKVRIGVGSLNGKRARASIQGVEELERKLRRMSDQARVEILDKAVKEGADETHLRMATAAPRNPTGPTRPNLGHGSDNIAIAKPRRRSKRDTRALEVGPQSFWMRFQEFGTPWMNAQPFVEPTGKAMRSRMVRIMEKHMKRVIRKGLI